MDSSLKGGVRDKINTYRGWTLPSNRCIKVIEMCSVGGPMADIDLKKSKIKKYICKECGREFKALGKPKCPDCKSKNVEQQ